RRGGDANEKRPHPASGPDSGAGQGGSAEDSTAVRRGAPNAAMRPNPAPPLRLAFEEALELVSPTRVTQLAQRLGLDLADPLAGDVELLADFLQRVVGAHLDAEAHPQHLRFERGEGIQHFLDD